MNGAELFKTRQMLDPKTTLGKNYIANLARRHAKTYGHKVPMSVSLTVKITDNPNMFIVTRAGVWIIRMIVTLYQKGDSLYFESVSYPFNYKKGGIWEDTKDRMLRSVKISGQWFTKFIQGENLQEEIEVEDTIGLEE